MNTQKKETMFGLFCFLVCLLNLMTSMPEVLRAEEKDSTFYSFDDKSLLCYFQSPFSSQDLSQLEQIPCVQSSLPIADTCIQVFLEQGYTPDDGIDIIGTAAMSNAPVVGKNYLIPISDGIDGLPIIPPQDIQPDCEADDPLFYNQWYLNDDCLNICDTWDLSLGYSDSVVVVIMDTGIELYHEEFFGDVGRFDDGIEDRIELVQVSDVPSWAEYGMDYDGHGTGMAGVIGAPHNSLGIRGVAPGCAMIVLDMGTCPEDAQSPEDVEEENLYWADINKGFEFVAQLSEDNPNKRYVVNCSFGFPFDSSAEDVGLMSIQIQRCLVNKNTLFVCANGAPQSLKDLGGPVPYASYPALFSGERGDYYLSEVDNITVAVGGTTYCSLGQGIFPYGIRAPDSVAWAAEDTCQMIADISAPAGGSMVPDGGILGVATTNCYNQSSGYSLSSNGTSMSCALVSGLVALGWSLEPDLMPEEIKYQLREYSKKELVDSTGREFLLYGTGFNWGTNRYKGYLVDCPMPDIMDPPVVFPAGGDKLGDGGVNHDNFCSPVFGSGMPDGGSFLENLSSGREVYRVYGGELGDDLTINSPASVYLFGDLIVPEGVTLSLNTEQQQNPWVKFEALGSDYSEGGSNPSLVEVVVEGGGRIETSGANLGFTSVNDLIEVDAAWSGFVIMPNGFFGNELNPPDVNISNAIVGITTSSSNVYIDGLSVLARSTGLELFSDLHLDNLSVFGSPNIGLSLGSGTEIVVDDSCDFTASAQGGNMALLLNPGSAVSIGAGGYSIANWNVGLLGIGPVAFSGDVDISNVPFGIVGKNSNIQIGSGQVTLSGPGSGKGVLLNSSSISVETGSAVTINYFDYGAECNGSSSIIGEVSISDSNIHGILVHNLGLSVLDGISVSNSQQDGVCIQGTSSVNLSNMDLENNSGSGLSLSQNSNGTLRNSQLLGNGSGIFVGSYSELDAGHVNPPSELGFNVIGLGGVFAVSNMNTQVVLSAEGNVWRKNGLDVCPPNPTAILGTVSTICN